MTICFIKKLVNCFILIFSIVTYASCSGYNDESKDIETELDNDNHDLYTITSSSTLPGKMRTHKDIVRLNNIQKVWLDSLSPEEYKILWPIFQIIYDRQGDLLDPDSPNKRLFVNDIAKGEKEWIDPREIVESKWGCYLVSNRDYIGIPDCVYRGTDELSNDVVTEAKKEDSTKWFIVIKLNDEVRLFSNTEFDDIFRMLVAISKRSKGLNIEPGELLNCFIFAESFCKDKKWTDANLVKHFGPVTYTINKD